MSSRDRLERLRAEAEVNEREKAAKRQKRERREPAKKVATRTKIVWAVKDVRGETLRTYPYPDEQLARAEAERLHAADGSSYFVTPAKVAMDS